MNETRTKHGNLRMDKSHFLRYWNSLEKVTPIPMTPIPYKHQGSTYAQDGIRITGSRKFVDAVLSNLRGLLEYESNDTRLGVVYQQVVDRDTGKPIDSWVAYIQVHERGRQARMMNRIFN